MDKTDMFLDAAIFNLGDLEEMQKADVGHGDRTVTGVLDDVSEPAHPFEKILFKSTPVVPIADCRWDGPLVPVVSKTAKATAKREQKTINGDVWLHSYSADGELLEARLLRVEGQKVSEEV